MGTQPRAGSGWKVTAGAGSRGRWVQSKKAGARPGFQNQPPACGPQKRRPQSRHKIKGWEEANELASLRCLFFLPRFRWCSSGPNPPGLWFPATIWLITSHISLLSPPRLPLQSLLQALLRLYLPTHRISVGDSHRACWLRRCPSSPHGGLFTAAEEFQSPPPQECDRP